MNNKDRYDAKMSREINPTLKGCPHCNCAPEIRRTHTKYWWVECPNCGAESGTRYGAKNAAKAWNMRANFSLKMHRLVSCSNCESKQWITA